jgi:hypothetical protein
MTVKRMDNVGIVSRPGGAMSAWRVLWHGQPEFLSHQG